MYVYLKIRKHRQIAQIVELLSSISLFLIYIHLLYIIKGNDLQNVERLKNRYIFSRFKKFSYLIYKLYGDFIYIFLKNYQSPQLN